MQSYYFRSLLAAMALLVPLYDVVSESLADTAALDIKYGAVNNLLEIRKGQIAQREPLQKIVDEYDQIVAMGGGFVEDLNTINNLAEGLSVEVSSIVHSGASISFFSQTDDFNTFREYVSALEASGRFMNPITPPEGYPYVTGGTITLNTRPPE